jgi:hypothetical protein
MLDAVRRLNLSGIISALLPVVLFAGCAVSSVDSGAKELSLNIISPMNNSALSSNVAVIKGTVSIPDTAVMVQGREAFVDSQGGFTGYAIISEGLMRLKSKQLKAEGHSLRHSL